MEKRCQEIQEQILDFVSDALPAEEAACVQEHIAKCPACSDYLRQLQADDK
ncbi:MAG: anti-sigma factor family protein, partial [Planctomycetota bacterium]